MERNKWMEVNLAIQKWLAKLLCCDFVILYYSGLQNKISDMLLKLIIKLNCQ